MSYTILNKKTLSIPFPGPHTMCSRVYEVLFDDKVMFVKIALPIKDELSILDKNVEEERIRIKNGTSKLIFNGKI